MMLKLMIMRRIRSFFDFIFEERRIILSSHKSTYYVNLSSVFQFLFVLLLGLFFTFLYHKYFQYVRKTNLNQIIAYNQNLEQVNKRLNHRIEKVEKNIAIVNSLIPDSSLEGSKADSNNSKKETGIVEDITLTLKPKKVNTFEGISKFEQRIASNLVAIHGKIDKLYLTAKQDSKALGMDPGYRENFRNIILKDQILNSNAVGGPFEPYYDETKALPAVKEKKGFNIDLNLENKVKYIKEIDEIINSAPLATPGSEVSTSGNYGPRIDPLTGAKSMHHGVDLLISDRKILAPKDGIVLHTNSDSGTFGKFIIVKHPILDKDGNEIEGSAFITKYAHLRDIIVKEGEQIKEGQVIGLQGSTGRSTGEHLHYEISMKHNGRNLELNPAKLLTFKNNG